MCIRDRNNNLRFALVIVPLQTALALLSRRHQLLISRAGTGKWFYGDTVFSHFEGVTFKAQFTQGTRVETILGGLDLKLFHEGKLWHDTSHSLVTADFAYLDEFIGPPLGVALDFLDERKKRASLADNLRHLLHGDGYGGGKKDGLNPAFPDRPAHLSRLTLQLAIEMTIHGTRTA